MTAQIMAYAAASYAEITAPEPAAPIDLAGLTARSDRAGAARHAAHIGCIAVTA